MLNRLRQLPFLRWSFLRMGLNMKHLLREWQVGDGREERLARHVEAQARPGDARHVIEVIDAFAYNQSFLINVGDRKGEILDEAVRRAAPGLVLELGAYCGYSALRMAVAAPEARIVSVEFSAANAEISRRIWRHAGMEKRIAAVVGTLGDGGATRRRLREEQGLSQGSVDLVFIDHDKEVYISDLEIMLEEGWLREGSLVVADNVKFPGAPKYLEYMRSREGREWRTQEHETLVEYQSLIRDLVLVSERLAVPRRG